MGAKTTGMGGNKFTDRLLLLAACAYQYSLESIESCWYTSPAFSARRAQGQYVQGVRRQNAFKCSNLNTEYSQSKASH